MLQDIIIVWFLTMGVFALTKEQMPFEFWQKIAYDKNLEMRSILFEPLTECLCCMASFWTCVLFGYQYQNDTILLYAFVLLFIGVILLSSVIGRAVDCDALTKYFYFAVVLAFALFLKTHRAEFFVCMVSVVGINYHLVKLLESCKE
jgi:hypothetical protein